MEQIKAGRPLQATMPTAEACARMTTSRGPRHCIAAKRSDRIFPQLPISLWRQCLHREIAKSTRRFNDRPLTGRYGPSADALLSVPPVSHERKSTQALKRWVLEMIGVDDGTRTHDNRNHNPGLYQLSYIHHCCRQRWLATQTLACPTGIEPVTPSLEGWCSIQLSYGQRLTSRACNSASALAFADSSPLGDKSGWSG